MHFPTAQQRALAYYLAAGTYTSQQASQITAAWNDTCWQNWVAIVQAQAELAQLDSRAIRSGRAIAVAAATGATPNPQDVAYCHDIESQAVTQRAAIATAKANITAITGV